MSTLGTSHRGTQGGRPLASATLGRLRTRSWPPTKTVCPATPPPCSRAGQTQDTTDRPRPPHTPISCRPHGGSQSICSKVPSWALLPLLKETRRSPDGRSARPQGRAGPDPTLQPRLEPLCPMPCSPDPLCCPRSSKHKPYILSPGTTAGFPGALLGPARLAPRPTDFARGRERLTPQNTLDSGNCVSQKQVSRVFHQQDHFIQRRPWDPALGLKAVARGLLRHNHTPLLGLARTGQQAPGTSCSKPPNTLTQYAQYWCQEAEQEKAGAAVSGSRSGRM